MNRAGLKRRVNDALERKGVARRMKAVYLSLVAEVVMDSDIAELQPCRELRRSPAHDIAAEVVLQYLRKKGFELAAKTGRLETRGALEMGNTAPKQLGIDKNSVWIRDLLKVTSEPGGRAKC